MSVRTSAFISCWLMCALLLLHSPVARGGESSAADASMPAGDSDHKWELMYYFDTSLGPSFDGHLFGLLRVYGMRSLLLGPLGGESTCVEWIHPGDDAGRDKMSLFPLYVHFVPFVGWRPYAWGGRPHARLWVDIYAGGSWWAFRAPGSWSTPEEERRDNWETGHKYFRAGVSVEATPSLTGWMPVGLELGTVWSESKHETSESDDWSLYLAVHVCIGQFK